MSQTHEADAIGEFARAADTFFRKGFSYTEARSVLSATQSTYKSKEAETAAPLWGKVISNILRKNQDIDGSDNRQLNQIIKVGELRFIEINFVITDDSMRELSQLYNVTYCASADPHLTKRRMVLRVEEREVE